VYDCTEYYNCVHTFEDIVTQHAHRHSRLPRQHIPAVCCHLFDALVIRWLGSVVVGCRTHDQEVASSTPGRCIAG